MEARTKFLITTLISIGSYLFIIGGAFYLLLSIILFFHGQKTSASVLKIEPFYRKHVLTDSKIQNLYSYLITYSYLDTSNRLHTFNDNIELNKPPYAVGDRIEITYIPEVPSYASVGDFIHLWVIPIFFIGIGATFVLLKKYIFRLMNIKN